VKRWTTMLGMGLRKTRVATSSICTSWLPPCRTFSREEDKRGLVLAGRVSIGPINMRHIRAKELVFDEIESINVEVPAVLESGL
jgi:hypothetical protein